MGFDLFINLNLEIDEKTGLPYVHFINDGFLDKKPYDPNEFKIPEKYHKYIEQRGNYFHSYIKKFDGEIFTARPRDFLDVYPSWEDVKNENELWYDGEDCWDETTHNEFKEFLEWMYSKSQYISIFEIRWSY